METKIQTHDEIRETFAEVRDRIQRSHLCLDAVIADYPIGRRERGKCRLQVERARKKGYRTVRTTTDKHGRWCAPKKSKHVETGGNGERPGTHSSCLLNNHQGHGWPVSQPNPEQAMSKKRIEKRTVVAASPVVHEPGALTYRIVIRDLGDRFVVHAVVFEPSKEPSCHQGDYFPKRNDAPTARQSHAVALRNAWARFEERTRRSLRMDPPPVKRLAQVTDIAEAIIKTLLPDDEDDCRDMINDD